jgi:hypothetical protein
LGLLALNWSIELRDGPREQVHHFVASRFRAVRAHQCGENTRLRSLAESARK